MATRKKTTKKAAQKAPARKATARKPRTKVAVSESVETKKRQRVERDLPLGTVLRRPFKGRPIEVTVVEGGFEYEDQTFKSISAVARRITGYGISGPVFFKLDDPTSSEPEAE